MHIKVIVRGIERRRIVNDVPGRKNLVKTHGVALAEVARQLGVSTSAISKIIKRAS